MQPTATHPITHQPLQPVSPVVKKDDNRQSADRHAAERAELLKLRDAAWKSQAANGRTGTCDFLKLLLDLHREIRMLDQLESAPQGRGADRGSFTMHHYSSENKTDEALAKISAQLQEIKANGEHLAERVHAMEARSGHATHPQEAKQHEAPKPTTRKA